MNRDVKAGGTVALHPAGQGPLEPSLQTAFLRTVGPQALDDLRKTFTELPVVTLSGVSFTGKSTLASELAKRMGGVDDSTGRIFRSDATAGGVSPAEWSRQVGGLPGYDVKLDYRGCGMVASGHNDKGQRMAVFEARLAASLGGLLRQLGRKNVITVFLTCSPRERVLRCAAREGEKIIPGAREHLEKILPDLPNSEFADYLAVLSTIADPVAVAVHKALKDEVARADRDRQRLLKEYGVDIADTSGFDVVVDNTNLNPEQVLGQVLAKVPKHFLVG